VRFRLFPIPFPEKRVGKVAVRDRIPSGHGKGVFK
jgi:hypothetical protein